MHEIEQYDLVFSDKGTEWHNLAKFKEVITRQLLGPIETPIVEGTPSVLVEATGEVIKLPGYKTILADLRGRKEMYPESMPELTDGQESHPDFLPLHMPKDSYKVISNKEIIDMTFAMIESMGFKITTAGTLGNLKKFFITLDIGDSEFKTENGDKHQNFLCIITSHDGTYPVIIYDSSIRIVCMNTLRWSLETQGEFGVTIRHTSNAQAQLNNFPAYLAKVIENRNKLAQYFNYLLSVKFTPTETAHLVAGYLSNPLDKEEMATDVLSTIAYNRANAVRDLSAGAGKGNAGKSLYDTLNGFTEYFTHHDGAGSKKATKAKRQSAASFGAAADHKTNFFDLCLDSARLERIKAIGAKLYADKHKAMMA